jgi:hypothetical protein
MTFQRNLLKEIVTRKIRKYGIIINVIFFLLKQKKKSGSLKHCFEFYDNSRQTSVIYLFISLFVYLFVV